MTDRTQQRRSAPASDPRVARSHAALTKALVQHLQNTRLSEISISELCRTAKVHRTTFYGHYPDLHALAASVGTDALHALIAAGRAGEDWVPRMLAHITNHQPLYRLVFGPLDIGFRRALQQQLEDLVGNQVLDTYAANYAAGGVCAALGEWAERDDSADVTTYAKDLETLMAGL